MVYVFKGEKNLTVRLSHTYVRRKTGLKYIKFNEDGIFKTEDEYLAKIIRQHFEEVVEPVQEPVEKPVEEPTEENIINLTYNELRKKAKEKGIEMKNPTKEQLLKELGDS